MIKDYLVDDIVKEVREYREIVSEEYSKAPDRTEYIQKQQAELEKRGWKTVDLSQR